MNRIPASFAVRLASSACLRAAELSWKVLTPEQRSATEANASANERESRPIAAELHPKRSPFFDNTLAPVDAPDQPFG